MGDPSSIYNDPDGTPNDIGAFYYDAPPAAPNGLTATPGDLQITLSWSANTESDLAYYRIYGGTTANPTTLIYQTTNKLTLSYIVTGLTAGSTYYYRITAVDLSSGESAYSSEVSATVPVISSLVAYYPFNGNANDESGNGNNGTNYGATPTIDRFGNANTAYSFNGTSNYIQIPTSTSFQSINSEVTISSWVKKVVLLLKIKLLLVEGIIQIQKYTSKQE